MEKYAIDAEAEVRIRAFEIDDTPTMPSLLMCLTVDKNMYHPDIGYDVDRIRLGLIQAVRLDCSLHGIIRCAEQCEHPESLQLLYFTIYKCLSDNREVLCKNVV